MTDFKRHCKVFYKFISAIKRHGMGYTSEIVPDGIKLSFWYLGTNYKEDGCVIWRNSDILGFKEAFYDAYEKALIMLKEHDPSKFKNIVYER